MKMEKAQWTTTADTVELRMPISKVDKENRLVSGFATLDNVDSQKDVVTAEASKNAFAKFRGNLREMHDSKIAAGHLVDFKEDSFYDPETEKMYTGIFVTAYVSKGAPNTWEKVMDKTLTGFSIGGSINDADREFDKTAGETVRFVKDYDLVELSLVDNPANQLANVFSITKSAEGTMMKGMAIETKASNVFWCKENELAKCSTSDHATCSVCSNEMTEIGWVENDENLEDKVKGVVKKFLGLSQESENDEGGVDMTVKETAEPDELKGDVVNPESPEDTRVEPGEPLTPGEELGEEPVATDEPDLEKMIGELQNTIKESLEKAEHVTASQTKVEEQIETISKSLEEFGSKAVKLDEQLTELTKSVEALRDTSESMGKSLEALEKETAIKKSGDLESPEPLVKSNEKKDKWNGAFVGVENL